MTERQKVVPFPSPTPDQEAYLRSRETGGYDPATVIGGPTLRPLEPIVEQALCAMRDMVIEQCADYAEKAGAAMGEPATGNRIATGIRALGAHGELARDNESNA